MPANFSFNAVHLDVLKEVGNIGSAHAATALSTLTSQPIDMSVPSVTVTSIMDVINPEESEKVVMAAHFELQGELEAHVFITFEIEEAKTLFKKIVKKEFSLEEFQQSAYYQSALSEIGNIMAGSYISALSDFTNTVIYLSPPQLGIDSAGALIGEGLIDLSLQGDEVILIDTVLKNRETQHAIKGSFLLLPKPNALSVLFSKLGVDEHGS